MDTTMEDRLPILSIEDLSPEVVMHMSGFLDKEDLGNLRLASKQWVEIAAGPIVEEVDVLFRVKSFQNLLRMLCYPQQSKHVRNLYYSTIRLEHITKKTLLNALDAAREAEGSTGDVPLALNSAPQISDVDGAAWARYVLLAQEQKLMSDAHYDVAIMAKALSKSTSTQQHSN
jgi:hypothetical protein